MPELKDHLVTVYEQAAEHHRLYILWREKLLAGFVVIIGALIYSLHKLYESEELRQYLCLVFLAGLFISYAFKLLAKRNGELFHDSQNVLKAIENQWELTSDPKTNNNTAHFFTIDNSSSLWESRHKELKSQYLHHGHTFNAIFNTAILLSLLGLVCSIGYFNFSWLHSITRKPYAQEIFKCFMILVIIGSTIVSYWAIFKTKDLDIKKIRKEENKKNNSKEEVMNKISKLDNGNNTNLINEIKNDIQNLLK